MPKTCNFELNETELCGGEHYAKGKCKIHYKMPSQLNPKPIMSKVKLERELMQSPLLDTKHKIVIYGGGAGAGRTFLRQQAKQPKDKESVSELLKELEIHFNRFIRKRDAKGSSKFKCISCNLWKPVEQMDAGHFHPKTYAATRFDENNVHGECAQCNRNDVNHLQGYANNLILKIGIDHFTDLEIKRYKSISWDRQELKELINHYKNK